AETDAPAAGDTTHTLHRTTTAANDRYTESMHRTAYPWMPPGATAARLRRDPVHEALRPDGAACLATKGRHTEFTVTLSMVPPRRSLSDPAPLAEIVRRMSLPPAPPCRHHRRHGDRVRPLRWLHGARPDRSVRGDRCVAGRPRPVRLHRTGLRPGRCRPRRRTDRHAELVAGPGPRRRPRIQPPVRTTREPSPARLGPARGAIGDLARVGVHGCRRL